MVIQKDNAMRVQISINKSEPKRALQLLSNMESECKNNSDIIELDGPIPYPENWKWYFYCSNISTNAVKIS